MAQIEPKGQNAIVVALLCWFWGIGYFYIGQKKKGIAAIIMGLLTCNLFNWLSAYDGYLLGQKLQNGEPIREHEVGLSFMGSIFGIFGAKDE